MKKIQKNVLALIKILALIMMTMFCIIKTDAVKNAVYEAVMRCLTVIIPSLYGMMIISSILVKSGLIKKLPGKFPVFAVSQFAGYPIGAKMLCSENDNPHFNKKHTELLSGVCFGAGPAFIFGCISSKLYGDSSAGKIILISTVSANVLLAVIVSLIMRKDIPEAKKDVHLNLSADTITKCISNSGKSMADICIMIIAFAVFTAFLDSYGVIDLISNMISKIFNTDSQIISGIIHAFLDVTAIDKLPENNYTILPIISGLVSFGGVCVLMQILTLTSRKINIAPIIFLRIASSIISAGICKFIMPFILSSSTVSAGNFSIHKAASPIPSILLIIMTVIVIRSCETLKIHSELPEKNIDKQRKIL